MSARRRAASALASAAAIGLALVGGTAEAANASISARSWTVSPLPLAEAAVSKVATVGDTTVAVGFGFAGAGRDTYFVPMAARFSHGTWTTDPVPLPAGVTMARLDDVAIGRPGDAWAVGSTNSAGGVHPLIEHWNGSTWSVADTDGLPKEAGLEGVAVDGPDDAWAVGYAVEPAGISPLVAHWDGTAWTRVAIPKDQGSSWNHTWLSGVSATGPDDVWIVGASNAAVHYDGHRWTETPPAGGDVWLERVRSSPEAGTWAVGYNVAANHVRTPVALKWNGYAWRAAALPSDKGAQLEDVAAAPGGMVAVGYQMTAAGPQGYALSLSDPGGRIAQPVALPPGATQLNGIAFGCGRLWAVGDGAYQDDGTIAPFLTWAR